MKLFDTFTYSDTRTDADLDNLAWFGVERVVTCAHAPRSFETARDLWQYFERLIGPERDRLERAGLTPHVAIGVHPDAVPRRAHYEIWRELPHLLRDPAVSALGELSLRDGGERGWSLVERQLRLLADLPVAKPAWISLSPQREARVRNRWLERLGATARGLGLDPELIVVQHTDWLTIDAAEAEGFTCGLSLSPFYATTAEALRIITHHDRRRVVLGSALREGAVDVLALPKLAAAARQAGIEQVELERVLYGNAMALLVRG